MKEGKMRKKNKKSPLRIVFILGIISISLCFPFNMQAKEKKEGATLVVEKQSGEIVQGELLSIKGSELILLDKEQAVKTYLDIREVNNIRVMKKQKFFKGLGNGLLFGAAGGAVFGFLSGDDHSGVIAFSAETKALVGGLFFGLVGAVGGGVVGAVMGIDESVSVKGMSDDDVIRVLMKLRSKARFPSESHLFLKIPKGMKKIEGTSFVKKASPVQNNKKIKNKRIKTQSPRKPPRFHLSFIPGYTGSLGIASFKQIVDTVGFDDDEHSSGGWWSSGPSTTTYPEVTENQVINIKEIRAEYQIGKKLTVGLSYAPLGHHRVSGRKIMPKKDFRGIIDDSYLSGKYSGSTYFLMVSFMSIPDAFTKKFSPKIGAGVGYSRIKAGFMTSTYKIWVDENENDAYYRIDRADYSDDSICFALFGEGSYYFNRTLSLGINVDYKYVPWKVDPFQLEAPYNYYAEKGGDIVYDSETIFFPSRRMNLGGVAVGLNIGFHF